MIDNIDEVVEKFKRVKIVDKATHEDFNQKKLVDFIGDKIDTVENILIILNTKKTVKDLYDVLENEYINIPIYHLSTSMCPNHRTDILNRVRGHLKANERVICISTQLIEAGVDISFECVIRSLAGLDSIAQAAGRCNRHGEDNRREVYVIDHEEENLDKLNEIRIGKEITKNLLIDLERDSTAHGGSMLSKQ